MKRFNLVVLSLGMAAMAVRPEAPAVAAAKTFLGTLTDVQRQAVLVPFSSEQRFQWAYVPLTRKGISWAEMSPEQRKAAERLLASALSNEGIVKVDGIRQLELVLRQIENNNMNRDPEKYWFAIYGEPSSSEKWGWRYEGHHTSLTFAFDRGITVSSTPQFLGSNPGEVRNGAKAGTKILHKEQDLGYALLNSLSPQQRSQAIISAEAPADILTMNSIRARIDHKGGTAASEFTKEQHKLIRSLLLAHSEIQVPKERDRRVNKALKDKGLRFVWMGSTKPGEKHYYRVQGDGFVVEYDNTQNDANHIHAVWRDFKEDFGGDSLTEHLEHSHGHTHSR
ncbi:MAG: DUF3500 domain-containing protein [Armatimonadota bacterium]